MEEFRAYLSQKYGAEPAQSVKLTLPVTPAALREAEAQAAKFKATQVAASVALNTARDSTLSASSSFRGHAVQTKKKIGENAQGDLWGFVGNFERLHFQRENERLAKEAEDRKNEYREILEAQVKELNARRHEEVLNRISDHRRMQAENELEKQVKAAERAEKERVRTELRECMASDARRAQEKLEKKRIRDKLERQRILEIMEAECPPGSEIMASRLNRKKQDVRAPWEKEDGPRELDIKGLCAGLDGQIKEKQEESRRQTKIRELEKQVLDMDAEKAREGDKMEAERRKNQRKQMDETLIRQMAEVFPLTKDQKMNRDGKNRDVAINQPLVRIMAQEPGFLSEADKRALLKR